MLFAIALINRLLIVCQTSKKCLTEHEHYVNLSHMAKKNASREYLRRLSAKDRKALASAVGLSHEYLYMVGEGQRTPSRISARKLEVATGKKFRAVDFVTEMESMVPA